MSILRKTATQISALRWGFEMASMHFRKPLKDLDGDAPVVSRLNSHKHMAEFEKKGEVLASLDYET